MVDGTANRCGHVAIVGRPNVGKSTLLNRLIGTRVAITSHKAQTTRHSILGIKSISGGQILYVDTPGIHTRRNHAMNRYLNRTASNVLDGVDLVLFVVEALRWTEEDEQVLRFVRRRRTPVLLLVNKVDRVRPKERLLPFLEELGRRHDFAAIIPVSAATGSNLEALEEQILARLPEADNLYPDDQLSDRPERFFAAEFLREQLTRRYAQELPYAVSVEIERFVAEEGRYRIHALIWVERASQRGILLGRRGAAMKAAASEARRQMEAFFGCKVDLRVWIKVKSHWSEDEAALARLGYAE